MALSEIDRLRREAIQGILVLKKENAPRISDAAWTNESGYNYGRWADKGFNAALNLLDTVAQNGEPGRNYLRRVVELMCGECEKYRNDSRDESGAGSGALETAICLIEDLLAALVEEPMKVPPLPVTPDAALDVDWEIWYDDLFDRECPTTVVESGSGLAQGLAKLWLRYLKETLGAGGIKGFARFGLRCQGKSIEMTETNLKRAANLRDWVVGKSSGGKEVDYDLLEKIAAAHVKFSDEGQQGSERILDAAGEASDLRDFATRLARI